MSYKYPVSSEVHSQTVTLSMFAQIGKRAAFLLSNSTRARTQKRMASHASESQEEAFTFGPYKIKKQEVFWTTKLSYALVNLRPVVPGHVLIIPKRLVRRFSELTAEETSDLWLTAQQVGNKLENHFKASSLTFTIQDGPEAGQSVPHVHIHILPRKAGDFKNNDDVYDVIDDHEKKLKEKLDLDKERVDRTEEEMAKEADELRLLFLSEY